jgi:Domain of unknown function (DUF5753)
VVMRQQLEHLVSVTEQHGITLQVVPYTVDAHPGLAGPFLILGFADFPEPDIAYLETVGGNLYVDKPEDVLLYATAFDHLRAAALSPNDTRAMLRAAADEFR